MTLSPVWHIFTLHAIAPIIPTVKSAEYFKYHGFQHVYNVIYAGVDDII